MLLLLILLIPIIEIYVFVQVGGEIGAGTTIWLVLLTAIVGLYFVKKQGMSLMLAMQHKVAENKAPSKELFEGICIAVAGVFLITPGFVTDTVGALLLWSGFRNFLRVFILDVFIGGFTYGMADTDTIRWGKEKFDAQKGAEPQQKSHKKQTTTIDADFEMIDDENKPSD